MENFPKVSEIFISIVVPAYGVVEYIEELIKSVIKQWDEDIELIIVNDGATDGLKTLLEEYKQKVKSDNFIVLNKKNGGLSSSRNEGAKIARGEYIIFLDGDDLLSKNSLKIVKYCLYENRPDCMIVDFNYYWDDGGMYSDCKYSLIPSRKIFFDKNLMLEALYYRSQVYMWRHIFKREIILSHPQPIGQNYEDISTTPIYIHKSQSFYYLPLSLILYRQRDGSIIKTKTEKNVLDFSSSLIPVTNYFKEQYSIIPQEIALAHSVFNLFVFTYACSDVLSNKDLDPHKFHGIFVDNFNKCNLVDFKDLKNKAKAIDKKTWIKFNLFKNHPKIFYFAHKMKHTFPKLYNLLNKLRGLIS